MSSDAKSKVVDLVRALEESLQRAKRPAPGREAPAGCEFVAAVDELWRVGGRGDRRCRYWVNGRSCGQPSVARMNRPRHRRGGFVTPTWWFYCAEHLYGRWIEDGHVMAWHVRENAPAVPLDQQRTP